MRGDIYYGTSNVEKPVVALLHSGTFSGQSQKFVFGLKTRPSGHGLINEYKLVSDFLNDYEAVVSNFSKIAYRNK